MGYFKSVLYHISSSSKDPLLQDSSVPLLAEDIAV